MFNTAMFYNTTVQVSTIALQIKNVFVSKNKNIQEQDLNFIFYVKRKVLSRTHLRYGKINTWTLSN